VDVAPCVIVEKIALIIINKITPPQHRPTIFDLSDGSFDEDNEGNEKWKRFLGVLLG
jgi:hypothetical protein